ncbi:MAG: RagB/SusD family nutrient uptake outer membrane protein [Saprospiraceae bacterium]|nr:RagB/SusD family nutrient uptake outer membrane protein [Candidatus Brachybacter algidus]
MKAKNIFLSMMALGLVLITSCSKDFLDKKPIVGVTADNFYKTEADAIAAINAAYAPLQFEMSPAGHFRWFWGDIMSDDSEEGGSGDNDAIEVLRLETFQGPTNTDLLDSEWNADYEGIYRANVVLEKVPAIEMDATLKARILAEAKFIRAWFYYNLNTLFGGVPLVDKVLAPSEYNKERADAATIWAFIEKDLNEAIADLPVRSGYGAADLGRITKGAAQGLLAKTYLYQQKFADARTQTQAIINSGEYTLVADYGTIFTTAGENNAESVFEIQYMNASGGNWGKNNANEGTFTNVFTRARGSFAGYGFNIPTQDFVDEFMKEGKEDPRLKYTVFRVGDAMGDRGIFTLEAAGDPPYKYHPRKYFSNLSEDAPIGDPNPNGGSNDRVIRYSDVLLMDAEAAAKTGDETGAKASLNIVRARVNMPVVTASGTALDDAIFHERRVELGLEGHRFFDLVRTGRAAAELGPLGFKEGVNNVFPIPNSQITLSNGVLKQNSGY